MAKEYPAWVKANVPGVGEVALVVQNEAEAEAVEAGTATFKVTRSAQDWTYEVVLPPPPPPPEPEPVFVPEPEPEPVEETKPVPRRQHKRTAAEPKSRHK